MDGQLWFDLYRLRWPIGVNVEKFSYAGKHKVGRKHYSNLLLKNCSRYTFQIYVHNFTNCVNEWHVRQIISGNLAA